MVSSLKLALLVAALLSIIATGCSNRGGTLQPPLEALDQSDYRGQSTYNHALWGIWEIRYDISALRADVAPARELMVHFNVTDYLLPPACNDCLKFNVNSFNTTTRIMDVDVTLKNPTALTGHDVRGILYTDDAGHDLAIANGWTGLFDIPGGGNINPFNSFAKNSPKRAFAGSAEYTEKYFVYIPIPPKYDAIKFAVDASWPGNCKEPYAITGFTQEKLYDAGGGQAMIQVRVKDWQKDVNKVTLSAKTITGVDFLQLYNVADDVWGVYIKNESGAPPGEYSARLIATSTGSGSIAFYDYVTIKVDLWGIPSSPVDITPPSLNFSPQEICIDANYAYIAAGIHGIHLFDISTPTNPAWVEKYDTADDAFGLTVSGNHLFVAEGDAGLEIFEIVAQGGLTSVKLVDTPGSAKDVIVWGDYAVVADFSSGATVIDINPIDSAYVVKTVDTGANVWDVATNGIGISGGCIYTSTFDNKMQIIDTNPIGSAHVIKEVAVTGNMGCLVSSGSYVYLANYPFTIEIIDVDPPATASIVKSIDTIAPVDVFLDGEYLYVADGNAFSILDIDPPGSASVVGQILMPGWLDSIAVQGNYVFAGDRALGLDVIDITSVSAPSPVTTILTPGTPESSFATVGNAYIPNYSAGLQILDLSKPSEAGIIKWLDQEGYTLRADVKGGYAYVAVGDDGVNIYNVNPPSTAYLEKNVAIGGGGYAKDVAVDGGYAYIADKYNGMLIADIDPISTASVVKTVDTPGVPTGIAAADGYVYLADFTGGFHIIDVDPWNSASIVKTIPLGDKAQDVVLDGSYAYVAAEGAGLAIVDISTPSTAFVTKTVDTPGYARSIAVSGGYAYIADVFSVQIIDIDPVSSASIFNEITPPASALTISMAGNLAIITDDDLAESGVWIYRLW